MTELESDYILVYYTILTSYVFKNVDTTSIVEVLELLLKLSFLKY